MGICCSQGLMCADFASGRRCRIVKKERTSPMPVAIGTKIQALTRVRPCVCVLGWGEEEEEIRKVFSHK